MSSQLILLLFPPSPLYLERCAIFDPMVRWMIVIRVGLNSRQRGSGEVGAGPNLRVGVTFHVVPLEFLFCGLKFCPRRLAKNSWGSASSLKYVA